MKDNIPDITVIVPVYQCENYVKGCIESILNQTYKNFELILVDDGSTDNSGVICDHYQKIDERVSVLHQENRGQAFARNQAVKLAKGKWIHFVDADDLIHPQMLEKLFEIVIETDAKIAMCDAYESANILYEFKEINDLVYTEYLVTEQFLQFLIEQKKYCYWTIWGKLIDIDILKKYPFTDGKIYEDNAVVFKWLIEAEKVVDTSEIMYYYTINLKSTTKKQFNIKKVDYLWALEEQIVLYGKMKYFTMKKIICKKYYDASIQMHYKVKNELMDTKKAKDICLNLWRIILENLHYFELSIANMKELVAITFPKLVIIYQKIIKKDKRK